MSADVMNQISRQYFWTDADIPSSATNSNYGSAGSRSRRPKSTPSAKVGLQHHGGSKMNRPKTAAAVLTRTDGCDRVLQVEHEPTRRHNFENHMPIKKSKPPPWQKNLDQPLVPFVVGPGYILSRSKSKFAVTIKDEFFEPHLDEVEKKKQEAERQAKEERDTLLEELQTQISDLTLYLEEERLNHKQTKQKAEEFLRDKVEELQNSHKDHVRELEEDHHEELEKLKKQLNSQHEQYKSDTDSQINKMKKELEFYNGAFESFQSTLRAEMDEKWNKKEHDLMIMFEEQKQASVHEIKAKIIQERNSEKINMQKEHQRSIESLRKEHKKELEALIRRFSNVAADLERLKKTTAELKEVKEELEQITAGYNEACQKLANTTRELADTKMKLLSFEDQFEEKVQQVDEKYKKKIQDLMAQNTELRRQYVKKCGELYDEKVSAESFRAERVTSAKEVMQSLLQSKRRAEIALTPGLELGLPGAKARPGSAPMTRQEVEDAQFSAGQLDDMLKQKNEPPIRPDVDLGEVNDDIEEMRKNIMQDIKVPSKEEILTAMETL